MQDTDLFLELAGIAGVFVGFGALISVRSGGPRGVDEVSSIRWVVSLAMAIYLTAVAVGLFGAALTLLTLVFVQPYPATASDPAELPATGGSSA